MSTDFVQTSAQQTVQNTAKDNIYMVKKTCKLLREITSSLSGVRLMSCNPLPFKLFLQVQQKYINN